MLLAKLATSGIGMTRSVLDIFDRSWLDVALSLTTFGDCMPTPTISHNLCRLASEWFRSEWVFVIFSGRVSDSRARRADYPF